MSLSTAVKRYVLKEFYFVVYDTKMLIHKIKEGI